jgi:ketosteroid isomerase-like protein
VDEARSYIDSIEAALADLPEDAEDDTEVMFDEGAMTKLELEERKEEVEQWMDEAERIADDANSVEFPGMYG